MNGETLISSELEDEEFESEPADNSVATSIKNLDSRRRLEDKLEELRLRRETQEFDFDVF